MVNVNLSSLGQNGAGPQANFTGSVSTLEGVNGVALTGSSNCKVTTVSHIGDAFLFYTTPSSGYNDYPTQDSGVASTSANFVGLNKVASGTFSITSDGLDSLYQNFASMAAQNVFGSAESIDLFNNLATMETNYDSAISTMVTALNATTSSTQASVELVNNLLFHAPERFTLDYKSSLSEGSATIVANETNGDSVFRSMTITGPLSGQSCTADVVFSVTGSTAGDNGVQVDTITIRSTPSTNFVENDTVIFSLDGVSFKIMSLTSTQASELNSGSDTSLTLVSSGLFLAYNSTTTTGQCQFVGESSNQAIPSHVFTGCTLTDLNGSGNSGVATVILNDDKSINTIFVTTYGSAFDSTSTLNIANFDVASNGSSITWSTTANSVQVAIVNGTLDNTSGTAAPLEADDTISVNLTVNSHGSQLDATGNSISFAQVNSAAFVVADS
jgi:hypothetical protein